MGEVGMVGKRGKVYFDDIGKVSCKEGYILLADTCFICIKTDRCDEFIPISKIVRVELK